jgi:hypothetical protein
MEFELSGIIMEINDLHKHAIGREKAQKPQRGRVATKAKMQDETIDQPATESWQDRIMRDCITL